MGWAFGHLDIIACVAHRLYVRYMKCMNVNHSEAVDGNG